MLGFPTGSKLHKASTEPTGMSILFLHRSLNVTGTLGFTLSHSPIVTIEHPVLKTHEPDSAYSNTIYVDATLVVLF